MQNDYPELAASFQEGKETPPQTTSTTSSKKTTWTVIKVSTQPSQAEGFLL